MSEAERKRRQDYKENRLKWIIIQIAAIALVAIIAIGSFIVFDNMNRTYYINYTESGSASPKVHNKNFETDPFLKEEWFDAGASYLSSSVDYILSTFKYDMLMDAESVGFDYKYSVVAQMILTDDTTGKPLYSPTFDLVPEKKLSSSGNSVSIRESVKVNYEEFDLMAEEFISSHRLNKVTAKLVVKLSVDVLSRCEEFENNNASSYFTAITIPLNTNTFAITGTASIPSAEPKVLACSGAVNQNLFLVIGIIALVLALLQGGGLVAFMYLTRNEDINYSIKVKKLVSSYRSFIQQIEGEFDTMGYQEIYIKSFVELLGIRDTIQSPILMSENLDKTCTKFLIPTATQLLYVFEIKVDNYDEIYNPEPLIETEEKEEDIHCLEEAIILTNDVDAEAVAEAIATPDVILSEIEYEMDDDDEFAVADDEPGVEVVGVVWPERAHKNKVYRYDPNGEQLEEGDVVLVPSRDAAKERDIIRKAAVAHPNHRVEPEHIGHPLKKIIGVVKRKVEAALTPDISSEE